MNRIALILLGIAATAVTTSASAHHSFAVYDMSQNVEFKGVVETVKFRNPHMAMTLIVTGDDGQKRTINFAEGAPANMLARLGLRPELIEPGTTITAIGAPRRDDPNQWFLKAIILPDGTRFNALQTPGQER
jgi:Family of unknown function (DUF6152)